MKMSHFVLLAVAVLPVGLPAQSTVTNSPPSVAIITPTNGSRFEAPANINVWANAIDRDGDVVEVSFYAHTFREVIYIGGVTNPPPTASPLPPWRIVWENVASGLYSLQARATDNRGGRAWSEFVRIEVRETNAPPALPIVNVVAHDAEASEGTMRSWPTGGSFVFTRSGSTADPLTVHFQVGGTAENGVDYRRISNSVTFAPGSSFTYLPVHPIDDLVIEATETVVVRLEDPVCAAIVPPPPGCYKAGSNVTATVFIYDAPTETNSPPVVRIISPENGSKFAEGAPIRICADAFDHTRYVDTVEFFAGDRSLGIVTNNPFSLAPYVPYCVVWSNAPAGDHVLTARATDNFGLAATSAPVGIHVGGTNVPPPPTNRIFLTIEAVDPVAVEQDPRLDALSDSALLVVRRHGPTNVALQVFYRVGGSAANGVDYARLSGQVSMPAGAMSAEIAIEALDDDLVEATETVIVTLQEPACIEIFPPPPECYLVGRPDTAIAYIRDNDSQPSNSPPSVRITAPANGARFEAGSDIRIDAVTVDHDGYAPRAEFFANGRKIGEQEIHFIQPPPDGTPIEFSFVWNDVEAGFYSLTVKGTDDDGAMALSAPIGIRVETNRPPPPPTNVVVSIAAIDSYAVEGGGTNSLSRGTNMAVFLVRRSGPTNDPVTVRYHIGGTASNGVDYAALSGEVTIGAGTRAARIFVVPLEDGLAEGIETVVLELAPAGGEPPSYLIGESRRAAAIIVDNDAPRPRCQRLADGLFHICVPGTDGDYFRLEASCNLVDWVPLCSSVVSDGAIHFVDPDVEALPYRFYRSVPATAPAEE
jgi:hypothetical protein